MWAISLSRQIPALRRLRRAPYYRQIPAPGPKIWKTFSGYSMISKDTYLSFLPVKVETDCHIFRKGPWKAEWIAGCVVKYHHIQGRWAGRHFVIRRAGRPSVIRLDQVKLMFNFCGVVGIVRRLRRLRLLKRLRLLRLLRLLKRLSLLSLLRRLRLSIDVHIHRGSTRMARRS